MQDTIIRCKCFGQNGKTIFQQPRWYYPNGQLIHKKTKWIFPYEDVVNDTQYDIEQYPYVYYRRQRKEEIVLVFPSSNDSYYNGKYTCGIGKDLEYTATVHIVMAVKPGMLSKLSKV